MYSVKKLFPNAYASHQMCYRDLPEKDNSKHYNEQKGILCDKEDKNDQFNANIENESLKGDKNEKNRKSEIAKSHFPSNFDGNNNIVTFTDENSPETPHNKNHSNESSTSSLLSQSFCKDILGNYKKKSKRKHSKRIQINKSSSDSKIEGKKENNQTPNQALIESKKVENISAFSPPKSIKTELELNQLTNTSTDCSDIVESKSANTQTNFNSAKENSREKHLCNCSNKLKSIIATKLAKSPRRIVVNDCLCSRYLNWTEYCIQANQKFKNTCNCCENDLKPLCCPNYTENSTNDYEVSSSLVSNIDSNESSEDDEFCLTNNYNSRQTVHYKSQRFGYKNNKFASSFYQQLFTCTPLNNHKKNNDWSSDDTITEYTSSDISDCKCSGYSCNSSDYYCCLPYQHNEDYSKLVEELEQRLLTRNKNRVRRTIQEFESRSRQNQNLDKPIFDYDDVESDSILAKFTTTKLTDDKKNYYCRKCNRANDTNKCKCLNEKQSRYNMRRNCFYNNLPDQPKNCSKFRQTIMKTHWQMDPQSGEWIKERGISHQNEFYTATNKNDNEGGPKGCCNCKMRSRT